MRNAGIVVAVVDKEFIYSFKTLQFAGMTNIDIFPAVAINVYHGYPGFPGAWPACNSGFIGNILELHMALVQVKTVAAHIAGKINILQSIAVYIADGYAAAIVDV